MLGEGRHRVEGRCAVGLLAPRVVGQRLVQRRRQVRSVAHQLVVDRHRVGHAGEAAVPRRAEAEEAHQVGPVGVVVERDAAQLVAAHRRIVDRLALVGDVAQDVAVLVLRPGLAEMQADAPVEEREVVVSVARRVERGDAREAAPVEERVDDPVELGRQVVEGEVVALELQRVGALPLGHRQGGVELGVVGRAQAQRPRPPDRRCRRPATRLPAPARAVRWLSCRLLSCLARRGRGVRSPCLTRRAAHGRCHVLPARGARAGHRWAPRRGT